MVVRDLLVVNRLEHAEETDVRLVERVVLRIVAGHNAPNDFATGTREEKCRIPVFVKGMFLSIEKLFSLQQQRGDPHGVVLINPPGKFDEAIPLCRRSDSADFNLRHEELISAGAAQCARANWHCSRDETA